MAWCDSGKVNPLRIPQTLQVTVPWLWLLIVLLSGKVKPLRWPL